MADDSTNPKVMSGYELAKRVLEHSSGGIKALLELSGNDESDWLELKAGMDLLPEDKKKGDIREDLFLNIAKAVLALANTSGGALIVGIDDKTHNVVPLHKNDPLHVIDKRGMEAYRREEILNRLPPNKKTWDKTQKNKNPWMIKNDMPANLIEVRRSQYKGEEIAVVLVTPASTPIRIWENEVELLPTRDLGEVGKVRLKKGLDEILDHINTRRIETKTYFSLWQRFLEKAEAESEEARLNKKIEDYYKRLEEVLKKDKVFGLSCFTPLDAAGEISSEEPDDVFMAPQAVELIVEDDSWLKDNDDADLKDDDFEEKEDDDEDNGVDEIDEELNEDEDEDEGNASRYREKRSGDLLELMHEIPRIAVLGEPGGGKTTTLKRFAIQFHQPENKEQILAVFIPMGQWRAGGSLSLLLEKTTGLEPAEWQKLIETNRLWLVIDAVNECPDGFRKAAVLNIQNFLREYSELPVAISARTDEDLKILHLPTFTVQPMDAAHQLNYLTSYLKDAEQAEALQKRLLEMSGGMEIAANPMLLRLVVEVSKTEGKLPAGRADLYHRWIKQWYKRENSKAKTAGEPLPWDFDKALEIFSELAFQSRLQGYRDVPMEIVESILEKFGEDCIAKLCQGPVVTAEEGFIRFRHETFQEYLCAEYLILHPDALPPLTKEDSAQWGMPLAYAAELNWPLSEPLWRASWAIDPWFGFAVTDDDRLEQAKALSPETNNPFLLYSLSFYSVKKDDEQLFCGGEMIVNDFGYSFFDKKLRYVVLTQDAIRQRWLRLELTLLGNIISFKSMCLVLNRSVALRQYAKHSINETFKSIMEAGKEYISSSIAERLLSFKDKIFTDTNVWSAIHFVENGFASKDDFKDKIPHWIQKASISDAEHIISAGLATREDFKERIDFWLKKASSEDINLLIQLGLGSKDVFMNQTGKWIIELTPQNVITLIQKGIATKDDFEEQIAAWEKDVSPVTAIRLLKQGIVSTDIIENQKRKWIQKADILTAEQLIVSGIASKDDFKEKMEQFIADATSMEEVISLVHAGLANKADFKELINWWIVNSTIQEALLLSKCGFAKKEDFACRKKTWITFSRFKYAVALIQNGFANNNDFSAQVERWIGKLGLTLLCELLQRDFITMDYIRQKKENWISTADSRIANQLMGIGLAKREDFIEKSEIWKHDNNPKTALFLIQNGFVSRESFQDKTEIWKAEANPQNARFLIQNGFASKEDFKDKIEIWKAEASLKDALFLIQNSFATREDFNNRIEKWKAEANPATARLLIQNGFASKEDFKDKIEIWKAESTPQLARFLIQNGFASKKDFKDKIEIWKAKADFKATNRLIRCRLLSIVDLKEKIEQWKAEANPTIALLLVQNGLASKEDFKGRIELWMKESNPTSAIFLIQNGLASKEDFKDKIELWIKESNPTSAIYLIQNGLASKENFKDKIELWIKESNPTTAIYLIQNGLATKDDFGFLIDSWIKNANPNVLRHLIIDSLPEENFLSSFSQWVHDNETESHLLTERGVLTEAEFDLLFHNRPQPVTASSQSEDNKSSIDDIDSSSRSNSPSSNNNSELQASVILPFRNSHLLDPLSREAIKRYLRKKKWIMEIVFHGYSHSLFLGADFLDEVFCLNEHLRDGSPTVGSIWSVEVSIQYDKKKKAFRYYVKHAKDVSSGEQQSSDAEQTGDAKQSEDADPNQN